MNFLDYLTYFKEIVDKNVEGWFYPIDIILMYGMLNEIQKDKSGCVCEIGVAFGRSAIAVSNYWRQGEMFYMFDHFKEEDRIVASENIAKYGTYIDVEWRLGDITVLTPETLDVNKSQIH